MNRWRRGAHQERLSPTRAEASRDADGPNSIKAPGPTSMGPECLSTILEPSAKPARGPVTQGDRRREAELPECERDQHPEGGHEHETDHEPVHDAGPGWWG